MPGLLLAPDQLAAQHAGFNGIGAGVTLGSAQDSPQVWCRYVVQFHAGILGARGIGVLSAVARWLCICA